MPNPKIIPITGGLGNQLFQYAHGRKLEIIDKKSITFDTSFFTNSTSKKDTPRPFLLDRFNINPKSKFSLNTENHLIKFTKKLLAKITDNYPLYQSEKYFAPIKETILKEFTLRNPLSTQTENISNNIKLQTTSVSIHIRRGDYANNVHTNKHHGLIDLDYYYQAVKYIKTKIKNPLFFIFSDDIDWVRANLKTENCVFVSNPNIAEVEELTLMSQCSHNIIANSTFSWWGAYLNKNDDKIVIAPKQWTRKNSSTELNILPKDWVQL
jgi:hypothetical protein